MTPPTPTPIDLHSYAIDAYAEAGLFPATDYPADWVGERYDAHVKAGDSLILARTNIDDERVTLTVTTLTGAIRSSEVTFPLTELGLGMFVAAVGAAATWAWAPYVEAR